MDTKAGPGPVPNTEHGDAREAPPGPAFRSSDQFNHRQWKTGLDHQYPVAPKFRDG